MKQQVEISTGADTKLTLVSALLLYQSSKSDVYASAHPIEIDANSPARRLIGAGVPLTKSALAAFADAVGMATAYSGFVSANVVYTAPNMLAWWTPAAIRTTWFRSADAAIGERHGPAAHPAMVFVVTHGSWFVFALDSDTRPHADTPVFHAPHFNVWDHGRICTGNVKLPSTITADAIAEFERCFFQSRFTHPNRQGAVRYKGGMVTLWSDQLARPDMAVMNNALAPANKTLGAVISHIIANQRLPR